MDRRDFLKVVLSSAIAAPLLATAKRPEAGLTVYLIGDEPQRYLPSVLEELEHRAWIRMGRFTVLNQHPFAGEIEAALSKTGWRPAPKSPEAGLLLSFEPLSQPAAPSFTLIKEGHVRDIRSRGLSGLWKEMNSRGARSACLTVASFRRHPLSERPGRSVAVYADGKRMPSFSLGRDARHRFATRTGEVVIGIEAGRARVLASTCRHKICLASAPVFLAGERIVCAPNRFLLEIEGPRIVDIVTG
jgi:hypothetical protein